MPENVWSKRDIVRAHHVGAKQSSAQRPIIVCLHHHDDKLAVLGKRIALKEKGIGVANDLTYNQLRQLQELCKQGQRGYFKNGQLVIEETPTTPATYVDAAKQKPSPRSSPEAGRQEMETRQSVARSTHSGATRGPGAAKGARGAPRGARGGATAAQSRSERYRSNSVNRI
ncbi:hypothetical protein ElyMa_004724000 [Elysia marginata]|uniref:Uncharacterized protein n=1 Tax=Elysia marginata TaxID=1093978 RepID=A0AAV4I9R7_9GAST|nr:hypothetical protein ElyMa_004724000 [Elysia marginata]